MDALQKEFSQAPLFQASISNIIKRANIPRGSFYQYFVDKEDAYFYMLNQMLHEVRERFLGMLEKSDGDLFDAMVTFYQTMTEEDENFHFFKNSLLNMNHKIEKTMSKIFENEQSSEQCARLHASIDKSKLKIEKDEELYYVMKIISAVTFHNLIDRFSKNLSNEQALAQYCKQIDMLKIGLVRD